MTFKKTFTTVAILLGATCLLHAGAEVIIKQRAKELRDENNARQGVPPRTPPPAQTPAKTAPAVVVASPGQQSMAKFQATLGSIQRGSALDQPLKQKMLQELQGIAEGTKPSKATAERFVTGLHKALSAKPLLPATRAKLAQSLLALLNPGKFPQAKPDAILEDVRSMLMTSGATNAEATDLAATVRLMAAEVKK